MRNIFIILFTMLFLNCSSTSKVNNIYYYEATKGDKIVFFEKRSYIIYNSFITENITVVDTNGNIVEKNKNKFKKLKSEFEIIINNESKKYLLISESGECTIYKHPIMYKIKNCYEKTMEYKGYKNVLKYNYSEEVIDGLNMTIYRDKNFSLIDKINIIGLGNYDKLVRINKSSVPKNIFKN